MLAMVKLFILKWLLVYSFYDKKSLKIPKGATRNRKLKRDRKHNGQKNKEKREKRKEIREKNKEKRTNNDPQNTTHKKNK